MRKKTKEEFLQEIKTLPNGTEYEFSGEYLGNKIKMNVEHQCGFKYSVRPINFTNGARCPKCSGLMKKDTDTFKKEVKDLYGNEYKVLGEYINSDTRISMKHSCGNIYEVLPHRFLAGDKCLSCYGNKKYTIESFKQKVKEMHGNNFEVLGEYTNNKTPIELKHSCGYVYSTRPDNFLKGHGCPKCNKSSSKGEISIEANLKKRNINYIRHYRFENLKSIRTLEFDFAVLNEDKSLNALIEFDGIQHFESTFYSKNLQEVQARDKMKDEYCKENNLNLIRIPYTNIKDIPKIIKNIEKSSTTIPTGSRIK
jgi:Zn ribbon nucleic-acid-binding protein